ncbi:MAG: tetratricopeptide repeat protein [Elusimicrobia bacterium]|nr:tetratricopeptide repeat protein [Elusimicrobiota bacterium]
MKKLIEKKWFLPAIIFLFALIIRLIYFYQIKDNILFKNSILDAKFYDIWAQEISKGDWLGKSRGVFTMSPGYPYLLGIIYLIFGYNIDIPIMLQFIMGSLICVFIYFLGKKVFNLTIGILSAFIMLLYSISIFYEGLLVKATVINIFNLLMLLMLINWMNKKLNVFLFLSGIFLGFSVHFRPNILGLIPLLIIWVWIVSKKDGIDKKKIVGSIVTLVLGVSLIIIPVALRNKHIGGEFVLSTAHGGMNFYTGNNPYINGVYLSVPFCRMNTEYEQQDFIRESERRAGRELTPKESSKFWYAESFKFIRNEPNRWLKSILNKFLIFCNSYETQINLNYYFFREKFTLLRMLPFSFGIIFPLALLGIIILIKNNSIDYGILLFIFYIIFYVLTLVLFFVVSEYRFPITPVVIVFASSALYHLYIIITKNQYKQLVKYILVLILLYWGVNKNIYEDLFGMNLYKESQLSVSHFNLGVLYEEKGDYEKSIKEYEIAIKINPIGGNPYINLAYIYLENKMYSKAIDILQRQIAINPQYAEAFNNLGSIYYKLGKYENAVNLFKKAVEMEPNIKEFNKNYNLAIQKSKK